MNQPWQRDGTTVYQLTGDPVTGAPNGVNRWRANVERQFCTQKEAEEIACLMMAAPKLFAACKLALAMIDARWEGHPTASEANKEWNRDRALIQTALALAEPTP